MEEDIELIASVDYYLKQSKRENDKYKVIEIIERCQECVCLEDVKELEQLLRNEAVASAVDYTLFKMNFQRITAFYYWSSTEINEMEAEIVHPILHYTGNSYPKFKDGSYLVRAVAKF